MGKILDSLKKELLAGSDKDKAIFLQRFFKTGKGEYAEGDVFLGITVPETRKVAGKYFKDLTLEETEELLHSKYHEERLAALIIMVEKFNRGDDNSLGVIPRNLPRGKAGRRISRSLLRRDDKKSDENIREEIYNLYLANTQHINNWDLVDLSADRIVGVYLYQKGVHKKLVELAKSQSLWERRIAMIATYSFIKKGDAEETLKIAEILLKDKHDLIHKAVGWMLREVGKRCSGELLKEFLNKHAASMPRTMLRYAIEKLPEEERKYYLGLK